MAGATEHISLSLKPQSQAVRGQPGSGQVVWLLLSHYSAVTIFNFLQCVHSSMHLPASPLFQDYQHSNVY